MRKKPFSGYQVFRDSNMTTGPQGEHIWRFPVPERPSWTLWICLRPEDARTGDLPYAIRFEKPDAASVTVFATTQDHAIVRANDLYNDFFKEPEFSAPALLPETVRAADPRVHPDERHRHLEFRLQAPWENKRPVWFLVDPGRHAEGNRAPVRGWLLGAVWDRGPEQAGGPSSAFGWLRYGREAGYDHPLTGYAESFEEAAQALLAAL